MNHFPLRMLFPALCLLLFSGASCQRAAEPVLDEGVISEDSEASRPPPLHTNGDEGEADYQPAQAGDRIVVTPEQPLAGTAFQVRAGPLTFRNGCEGIERSWAEPPDGQGRIVLRWEPRAVPPGAMCTMALHNQWIEATIEGLEAGEYLLVAEGVGEKSLTVVPPQD